VSAAREVDAVIPLLERKLRQNGMVGEDSDYAKKFITESLGPHFHLYVQEAPWYKNRYRWMASAIITFGFLSSALGAVTKNSKSLGTAASYGVIVLGILIGVLSHWLQIWKPSERAVAFYHARTALRTEIWDFLTDDGVYGQLEGKQRFPAFVRHVLKIENAATVIDEQRDTAAGGSSSGNGGPSE
jgi:hypothetical protein